MGPRQSRQSAIAGILGGIADGQAAVRSCWLSSAARRDVGSGQVWLSWYEFDYFDGSRAAAIRGVGIPAVKVVVEGEQCPIRENEEQRVSSRSEIAFKYYLNLVFC